MGIFLLPPPQLPEKSTSVAYINMIFYCTTPFDPWVVPDQSNLDSFGDHMSLSPIELDYIAIH